MNGILNVISEHYLNLHKEYVDNERLKLSVLEKSISDLHGKKNTSNYKKRFSASEKDEIINKKRMIEYHQLYFTSFCNYPSKSNFIIRNCSSAATFLYDIYKLAVSSKGGFLILGIDNGKPCAHHSESVSFNKYIHPILAIDLEEHSYFGDYGFMREEYIKKALSHLDIGKFDNF